MPSFGQFLACITVNNTALPEYGVEVDKSTETVTCWIPSKEGQAFIVKWRDNNNQFDFSGDIRVDGVDVGGRTSAYRPLRLVLKAEKGCVRTSSTSGRPLVFSKVELTEDDEYLARSPHQELGEIRLTLSQIKVTGYSPHSDHYSSSKIPDAVKLHERTKKLIGHCVSTGNETVYKGLKTESKTIRTLATFIFKYRPLAILQAKDIAPLTTKRLSSTKSRKPDTIAKAKASRNRGKAATIKRIAAMEREIRSLRKSVERPAKKKKIEIKTEPRPSPIISGNTIDLT